MSMKYNDNPISLREGKVFIDGVECLDSVKCEIKFTPDVWEGKQLGDTTPSSRWLGAKISGNITRRRSTPWLKDIIKKYIKDHKTPEITIQGIMEDKGSDYYEKYGTDTVTCVGCVLTGDLPLTALDSEGDVVDDNIAFNAKDIV
ncbi:phage tail tube protein [uncultured Ruminococcus sp.]|uniref:phage tail tube protein n=1 Tax=uncultured Ruminococcus sp. TaxID=165186 RepID=UPI0025F93A4F|nr:phage tail tube protein [uncultured Ruminococcus sp.]